MLDRIYTCLSFSGKLRLRAPVDEFRVSIGQEFETWHRVATLFEASFDMGELHDEVYRAGFCEIDSESDFVCMVASNKATKHIFDFLSAMELVSQAMNPWCDQIVSQAVGEMWGSRSGVQVKL